MTAELCGSAGDLDPLPSREGVVRLAREFVHPHRVRLAIALSITVISAATVVAGPVLIGRIVDGLLDGDRDRIVVLCGLLVLAGLVQVVTAMIGRDRLARTGEFVVRDLRDRVVDHLSRTPLRFLERHRHGELLQRGTAEIAALSTFVRDALTEIVVTSSTVVIMLVVLVMESWLLTVVALLGFLPLGIWLLHSFRRAAPAAYAAESAAEADLTARMAEVVRVQSVLVGASPAGKRHWVAALHDLNGVAEGAQRRTAVLGFRIHALVVVQIATLAALAVVGAWLVGVGSAGVSVGVVVTFLLAGRILFAGFADLASVIAEVEEAATGAARTQDLLRATATSGHVGQMAASRAAGSSTALVVEDVRFGYGDDVVLDGFSARFEPGERVGLAGRSGAGKSTLVKLLAGLYAPDTGRVRCGPVDLSSLAGRDRARWVTLVPQQVQLGPGTVRDELRLAGSGASDDVLVQAAERIGLAWWLTGLADGLDTTTGFASPLSAGERQLIGLIRVAMTDTSVLILDEATSDIDPDTADLVEAAVDRLALDRTVIVVAHRPETLARLSTVYEVRRDGLVRLPATDA